MGVVVRISKAIIVTAFALNPIFGVGAASAADLPLKSPPPVLSTYNWTGFYVGAEAGGVWSSEKVRHGANDPIYITVLNTNVTNPFGSGGGLFGETVGYNYQFNRLVLGAEGDISGAWLKASTFDIAPFTTTFSEQIEQRWLATIRGRVGFLALPSVLLYETAGFAAADVKHSGINTTGTQTITETHTMTGWTAGVGAEWEFTSNWSAKLEYLHVDLGRKSYFNPSPSMNFISDQQVSFHEDIVRLGVNYQFGMPVVAKN